MLQFLQRCSDYRLACSKIFLFSSYYNVLIYIVFCCTFHRCLFTFTSSIQIDVIWYMRTTKCYSRTFHSLCLSLRSIFIAIIRLTCAHWSGFRLSFLLEHYKSVMYPHAKFISVEVNITRNFYWGNIFRHLGFYSIPRIWSSFDSTTRFVLTPEFCPKRCWLLPNSRVFPKQQPVLSYGITSFFLNRMTTSFVLNSGENYQIPTFKLDNTVDNRNKFCTIKQKLYRKNTLW